MRVISLCLCCMLMAYAVAAQRNYVPGTIITSQNDSLKGFIDFRNWYQSPTEIAFKESLSKGEQRFKPEDIKGFTVAVPEVTYVSSKLRVDITPQDIKSLSENPNRTVQDTPVFMMRIVTGRYNLYEYIDKFSRTHYVYDAPDMPAAELEYIQHYIIRASNDGIFTDERYKGQLAVLFSDNETLSKKARKVAYRAPDLKKLFLDYNGYKVPESSIQPKATAQKKARIPVTYGIMGGIAFNSYPFNGSSYIGFGDYKSSKGPIGGIWADIPLGRTGRNISFVPELLYKKLETSGVLYGTYTGSTVKFGFNYLQVNTLFRYTYPTKTPVRPYINAGIGNGFVISTSDNGLKRWSNREWETAIDKPRKYEQSFVAGIGVKIFKVNAEVRYNTSNGFSPYTGAKSAINSFQFLAAYGF